VIDSKHRKPIPHLEQDEVSGLARLKAVGEWSMVHDDRVIMPRHQLKARVTGITQGQGRVQSPRVTAREAVSRLLASRTVETSTTNTPTHRQITGQTTIPNLPCNLISKEICGTKTEALWLSLNTSFSFWNQYKQNLPF